MNALAWRKWRDSIASTFDAGPGEEERLRETLDLTFAAGVDHMSESCSTDVEALLDTVGLAGARIPRELR